MYCKYLLQVCQLPLTYYFFFHTEVLNFDMIQFIKLFLFQLGFLHFIEIPTPRS